MENDQILISYESKNGMRIQTIMERHRIVKKKILRQEGKIVYATLDLDRPREERKLRNYGSKVNTMIGEFAGYLLPGTEVRIAPLPSELERVH